VEVDIPEDGADGMLYFTTKDCWPESMARLTDICDFRENRPESIEDKNKTTMGGDDDVSGCHPSR
jgi:hypothetical protein